MLGSVRRQVSWGGGRGWGAGNLGRRQRKEYPTAHALIRPQRQHWDIAVIKTPAQSEAEPGEPGYDYLKLAAVVEFGMNETEEHLRDDLARFCHERANVEQGFMLHLYRLSEGPALFSGRDWPAASSRILSVGEVQEVAKEVISCPH